MSDKEEQKNRPNSEVVSIWRERICGAIALMDERGRANEGDNSEMLWHREWKYLRNELFEVLEHINIYLDRANGKVKDGTIRRL